MSCYGIERPTPDGDFLYMVMRDQKNGITIGFENGSGEIMPILGIDNDGYLHLAKNIPEWTGIKTNDEGQIIREEEDSPEIQPLSQMANSYCLEEDFRRIPAVQIVPSHRREEDGNITRKWVINSGPGNFVQFLAADGTDCWVCKGSDEHGGVKRFDTPEEACEEWTTKHREPWRAAMKELGWKFWEEEC